MNPRRVCPLVLLACLAACLSDPDVDLDGPRVVGSSLVGPRSVELAVLPELVVEFAEPMDPASIHPGSVAVVAWDELESCALTPQCPEGSCERGTCQRSPLSIRDRRALDRGEFEGGEALDYTLDPGPGGDASHLTIRPRRPLDAHRRYSVVVGAGVRDRSGAPLVDDAGQVSAWQRDFVTAGRGSAGPEPRLVRPSPGQLDVPSNLASVDTQLWPPVVSPTPLGARLRLEAELANHDVWLVEPRDCPGWVPGTCLRWRPEQPLEPGMRYRPADGDLVDRFGRPALLAAAKDETWFRVGDGPDLDPPEPTATAQIQGHCLAVWLEVGEVVAARLEVAGIEHSATGTIAGSGWIAAPIPADGIEPDGVLSWSIALRDLADNDAVIAGELAAGPGFLPELPELVLTEILANPSGPEPSAEFVELRAGGSGAVLDGVYLADARLAEVRAAWAAGDLLGDPLPAVTLDGDEIALVVASGYGAEVDDPEPAAGTRMLVVDASLGTGGLRNAGEPITLWIETEQGPVALASYGDWIDTSASAHEGRSVVATGDGCDLPDRWRSHPLGRSTPGRIP